MISMRIHDHLIIPFGREKWNISKIRIVGVSTSATYFESETPCAYLDRTQEEPLRLADFKDVFPEPERFPVDLDDATTLEFIFEYLKTDCQLQTPSESLFLDLYSQFLWKTVQPLGGWQRVPEEKRPIPQNGTHWLFSGLMPLPQAHLYLDDPLRMRSSWKIAPQSMYKVDFAFWTGKKIIAVEIDGCSHIGNENHVKKDRLLHRAGVEIVHILNDELTTHGVTVIERLFPAALTRHWEGKGTEYACNPLMS